MARNLRLEITNETSVSEYLGFGRSVVDDRVLYLDGADAETRARNKGKSGGTLYYASDIRSSHS